MAIVLSLVQELYRLVLSTKNAARALLALTPSSSVYRVKPLWVQCVHTIKTQRQYYGYFVVYTTTNLYTPLGVYCDMVLLSPMNAYWTIVQIHNRSSQ